MLVLSVHCFAVDIACRCLLGTEKLHSCTRTEHCVGVGLQNCYTNIQNLNFVVELNYIFRYLVLGDENCLIQ